MIAVKQQVDKAVSRGLVSAYWVILVWPKGRNVCCWKAVEGVRSQ